MQETINLYIENVHRINMHKIHKTVGKCMQFM